MDSRKALTSRSWTTQTKEDIVWCAHAYHYTAITFDRIVIRHTVPWCVRSLETLSLVFCEPTTQTWLPQTKSSSSPTKSIESNNKLSNLPRFAPTWVFPLVHLSAFAVSFLSLAWLNKSRFLFKYLSPALSRGIRDLTGFVPALRTKLSAFPEPVVQEP